VTQPGTLLTPHCYLSGSISRQQIETESPLPLLAKLLSGTDNITMGCECNQHQAYVSVYIPFLLSKKTMNYCIQKSPSQFH